jgi:hypothetical protein
MMTGPEEPSGHSESGAEHWATIASLIETCKINDVNPLDYLTDVITRIVNGHPNRDIDQLLPWAYRKQELKAVAGGRRLQYNAKSSWQMAPSAIKIRLETTGFAPTGPYSTLPQRCALAGHVEKHQPALRAAKLYLLAEHG